MWYLFCSSPGAAVPGFAALTAACSCNTMGAFACQVPRILDSFKPLVAAELMHDNVPAKYDTPIAYELSKILGSQ